MLSQNAGGVRSWFASGEPWVWMNAAAVAMSIIAVVGLLGLIAVRGLAHFWPADVLEVTYQDRTGQRVTLGERVESEFIPIERYAEASVREDDDRAAGLDVVERTLYKVGNRRATPPDFMWIYSHDIVSTATPESVFVLERTEWGNAYGYLESLTDDGVVVATGADAAAAFLQRMDAATELREEIAALEGGELNRINYGLEQLRLEERRLAIEGRDTPAALADIDAQRQVLNADYLVAEEALRQLHGALARSSVTLRLAEGRTIDVKLSEVVRAWQPNTMSVLDKLGHYGSSVALFLTDNPREANTEGGIFPAIFGTVLMVMLMSILVTPFGVIAAIYLREYARQGTFVRLIRIAVNNLAGVPSIVYGVFGLGFFVYFIGGTLDELFYPEALPSPTFGTPGLVWASLTLALLTVPVVVVSTEEGLTRIPRSLREGSMALGATKAETLFRVILPMASPSILTGVILAIARAAGEVAPLMLVGVVKLAPTLPLDGNFPFIHLERKFMHLGFHIYDVGFQSPNVEAARPLVFATALLLVLIIVGLNLTAIMLRNRLEQRYRGVES